MKVLAPRHIEPAESSEYHSRGRECAGAGGGPVKEARVFLEALFAGKPKDLHLLIWTLPEKESRWFRDVEDAIRCAEAFHGQDLYVGLGLAEQDYGPKRRCPSEEVAGIVG